MSKKKLIFTVELDFSDNVDKSEAEVQQNLIDALIHTVNHSQIAPEGKGFTKTIIVKSTTHADTIGIYDVVKGEMISKDEYENGNSNKK